MDIESYISENSILQRKLESKEEALVILSNELSKCQEERDELKKLFLYGSSTSKSLGHFERYGYVDSDAVKALSDKNKALYIEIRDLRHKLHNAYADLKVLRGEKWSQSDSLQQKEELMKEVEEAKAQLKELRSDIQALLDEKEELVTERDAYRCKVHRLNHELARLLGATSSIDVDAILMESRYLKERLEQATAEIEITKHMLSKYKGMLDKKRAKGTVRLAEEAPTGRVLSHKQVAELLGMQEVPGWEGSLPELHALCLALVDSLQDKSLCLSHQRKANRLLAERVQTLEDRLAKHEPAPPSQLLLDGYNGSAVDTLPPIATHEKQVKGLKETDDFQNVLPNVTNDKAIKENDVEKLPKELQDLVNKALQEVTLGDEKQA